MYKTIDEIKSFLGMSKNEDIAKVLITPKMAEELLDTCNIRNRNLNTKAAAFLGEQFNFGNYFLSSTCIGFDSKGTLTDGQHRLMAISMCNADKKFLMGVMFGVEQNMDMDTGRKRTLVDNALISDKFDSKLKISGKACVQVINSLCWMTNSKQLSQNDKTDICNYFAEPLVACYNLGIFNNKHGRINNTVKLALFAAYLNGVPSSVLTRVYNELVSGEGELYSRISTMDSSGRVSKNAIYRYTQSYIYKLCKGLKGKIRFDKVYYKINITNVPHLEPSGGEDIVYSEK